MSDMLGILDAFMFENLIRMREKMKEGVRNSG